MDLYKEMYDKLFNRITDVIRELQTAQRETEEMFLSQSPEPGVLALADRKRKTGVLEKAKTTHEKNHTV